MISQDHGCGEKTGVSGLKPKVLQEPTDSEHGIPPLLSPQIKGLNIHLASGHLSPTQPFAVISHNTKIKGSRIISIKFCTLRDICLFIKWA